MKKSDASERFLGFWIVEVHPNPLQPEKMYSIQALNKILSFSHICRIWMKRAEKFSVTTTNRY